MKATLQVVKPPATKVGWAAQVTRRNGATFLACECEGILPQVWRLYQKRYARSYVDELLNEGVQADLVKVSYTMPQVIGSKISARK